MLEANVLWCREEALEVRLVGRLREHFENAAAVVVQKHHNDARGGLTPLGRNLQKLALQSQRADVVLKREIPGQKSRLREVPRYAQRGGDRAVDAVETAIAEHGDVLLAFRVEGVDRADGHGIRREHA